MDAIRRWKRDGSRNVMRITTAAASIRRNAKNIADRKQELQTIIARLIRGEVIETLHAEFSTSMGNFL